MFDGKQACDMFCPCKKVRCAPAIPKRHIAHTKQSQAPAIQLPRAVMPEPDSHLGLLIVGILLAFAAGACHVHACQCTCMHVRVYSDAQDMASARHAINQSDAI